jgi:hypothetical protein
MDSKATQIYLKERYGIDLSPKAQSNRRSNGNNPIPYRRLKSGKCVHEKVDVDTWAMGQVGGRYDSVTQERNETGRRLPMGVPPRQVYAAKGESSPATK